MGVYWVEGLGFRILDFGCRVPGLGFRQGGGCRGLGLGCPVWLSCSAFRV